MMLKRFCSGLMLAAISSGGECAGVQIYFGYLAGINESPPVATAATGFALVTYSPVAGTMRVQITFSGLSGTTTGAHIHCCFVTPATNAPVATMLPAFTGFPLGVTAGTLDHTFDMTSSSSYNSSFVNAQGGSVAAAQAVLFNGMANGMTYLNIHTTSYPGGEIRANLIADAVFANGFEPAAG